VGRGDAGVVRVQEKAIGFWSVVEGGNAFKEAMAQDKVDI
jgi:hypothetical protein